MVDAIPAITTPQSVAMFEKFGVFTKTELESRSEIQYESYSKVVNIEARTMTNLASKLIIPAVIDYTKKLADTVIAVKEAGADAVVQAELLGEVSGLLKEAKEALKVLEALTEEASSQEDCEEQAHFYYEKVIPAMAALRAPVDKLEMLVDKKIWPMPSYGDLLFEV